MTDRSTSGLSAKPFVRYMRGAHVIGLNALNTSLLAPCPSFMTPPCNFEMLSENRRTYACTDSSASKPLTAP
jgi:hypothetical protein